MEYLRGSLEQKLKRYLMCATCKRKNYTEETVLKEHLIFCF